MTTTVAGFAGVTGNAGVKDAVPDVSLVHATGPTTSSAVFTRSLFAGPSVELSRSGDLAGLRAVVVVSGNANVATGAAGLADAGALRDWAADRAGCAPEQVLVASTGVIGVPYPMDRLRAGLAALPAAAPVDLDAVAQAIMTTDTHPKVATRQVGAARVVGIAKGVGMIEPDMATMLSFVYTDAEVPADDLDRIFRSVVARTYNAVSVDTDTSTSDTAAVLASGAAGPVDLAELEAALLEVCTALVRMIASDGEGASTLIEVRVTGARDDAQAKLVGKSVVNSPLVKTAVHGADPNWGRVAMAIGKCSTETDIRQEAVRIAFGGLETYPTLPTPDVRAQLEAYLGRDEVVVEIDLGIADGAFTVYGCDLTEGYIRINADYTT
ncbi:bifunctional glutamate N-acetyltransferase/amino-acid acetyltransferase ArgJ [Cellulomonas shaoxiangyii]|uniref:Arginine biosynthesis bifunctional protein ArgJ n=1 Tax=Cellulomonas shaoxiangyii TaxID=2566013 RepID=A0A4P7SGJ1_9CELL|nr:bifunctional glutamate N-acetyltransferase/amino-acid acetyltransferase ArgJ [Cellulomonas shaoxiangyii]QCB92748.1 bifunctional glutamate N-acetyltransferase/amino-acid acetyltransferase ArgJ [Cellulomonas shaoxiangyii]TGY76675.1 bifunctional glutamate N-acetyltransferase/amino-acid acetyltransferase ArgJ [Cellulomonas shaoxiangyii]